MRSRLPATLGVLFVASATLSLLLRGDDREFSLSSYGTVPDGFGALHDVLVELGVPVSRSFVPPDRLDPHATVWWIEPYDACEKLSAPEEGAPALDLAAWLREGGTAVWFSSALARCGESVRIVGLALPEAPDPEPNAPEASEGEAREAVWITGALVPQPRRLPEPPRTFATVPEPFRVIARAGEGALAIEAPVGEGHLVLVADAFFLRNQWLDRDDAALLALDWVRAYGVPILDEREHGLRDMPSTSAYLVHSPALPVFAGLAATGLLFAWAGASLPRRRVGESGPAPPTLATYVDSLARLYARTGDHAEVYERYRLFALAELRRALALAHDAPAGRVLNALEAHVGSASGDLSALRGDASVQGRADLDAACASIDHLLARVR